MATKAEIRLWGAGWIAERRPCITEACMPGELERQRQLRFHTSPILEQNPSASVNAGRGCTCKPQPGIAAFSRTSCCSYKCDKGSYGWGTNNDNIQLERDSEAVTHSVKFFLTHEPTWCRRGNSGVQDSWKRRLQFEWMLWFVRWLDALPIAVFFLQG